MFAVEYIYPHPEGLIDENFHHVFKINFYGVLPFFKGFKWGLKLGTEEKQRIEIMEKRVIFMPLLAVPVCMCKRDL